MPTFKLHDESVNSYGFRCLTSGGDFSLFDKNPIMLYNHLRGVVSGKVFLPIGKWEGFKVKGTEIFADTDFDQKDKFAKKIEGKVDRGYMRMASIGLQILETSDDPALMLPGQTRETVTKWLLKEGSIAPIGSNRKSLVLYDQDGAIMELSDDGKDCPVPLINLSDNNSPTKNTDNMSMESLKIIAGFLGLKPDATLSDVQVKISELNTLAAKNAQLSDELKVFKTKALSVQKGQTKTLLDKAIQDKRIDASQRENFETLFDKDFDSARNVLQSMSVTPSITDILNQANLEDAGDVMKYQGKTFSELRKEKPQVLANLKDKNINTFKQLFKSEYGKDYTA